MIDIEKLADENGGYRLTDQSTQFTFTTDDLKQFAESYAAKVLEDKEREIAELKTTVRSDNSKVIAALNAHINDLREALELAEKAMAYDVELVKDALYKTPAQSLQEIENEVIEKCAKVCDDASQPHHDEIHTDAQWAAKVLAANIRALKGE